MSRQAIHKAFAWILTGCAAAWAEGPDHCSPSSFAYVLQAEGLGPSRADAVRRLTDCGRDWIILDACFEGGDGGRWTAREIAAIRAGRPGRVVLAYLSVGEAEDYRSYWNSAWDADHDGRPDPQAPDWLCGENPDWKGNYKVRYWSAAWQSLLLKDVDSLVAAGFDGVYLDIIDAFEFFEYDVAKKQWIDNRKNSETGKTYREDMIAWVCRLAEHTRRQKPGFRVVPQNGVQLLADTNYLAAIDAVGAEDVFTNGNRLQKKEHIAYVTGFLQSAVRARKPVLLIEYGTQDARVRRSFDGAAEYGFVPLVTDRALKTLGRASAP